VALFLADWNSNAQHSASEAQLVALAALIGGAILVSLNRIKPQS
jgi:hypothetical protein